VRVTLPTGLEALVLVVKVIEIASTAAARRGKTPRPNPSDGRFP
jgi:hypothetical protein